MELLPVKEKYNILIKELEKLKGHIKSLENEGKNLCDSVSAASNSVEFRKIYYRALKQYDSYVDRIVEINCNIEIQPFNEPIKDDLQLFMDIPFLPHLAEQKYEMTYIDGDSPWNFWLCHTISRDDFEALQVSLRQKLSEGFLEPLTSNPVPGDYICFSDSSKICRGIITDVLKKQRYKILDVDTSAVRIVSYDKLLKIDGEMIAVHWQAMNCFLLESTDDAYLWTGELQRIFSSVLKCNKLMVNVVKKREDIISSFLVEITATDEFTSRNDDTDGCNCVCNIKEWVCDRILPELRRNASSGKVGRTTLSISALDAFYGNTNDHDDDFIVDSDTGSISSLPEKLENVSIEVGKKELTENEQDDLLKSECPTLETDCKSPKEQAQVKQEVGVFSSCNDYDRPNSNVNEHFNESDNYSIKSNSSNSNSVNQSYSIGPTGQDQCDQPEVTTVSTPVSSSQINHTVTYSNSSPPSTGTAPLHPASVVGGNQHQQSFVGHSNMQQVPSMYQLHGPPIMMRPGFAWKNVRYSPPDPFYPPSPLVYKHKHVFPIQHNIMPLPNPGMHYWNRPIVPPPTNSNGNNYPPWSTATNENVTYHRNNMVNSSDDSSSPSKCFPDPGDHGEGNVVSSTDNLSDQSEVVESVTPVSHYQGYKVELKHQISLIDPEEEISAVISCVLSPDEIYVHLATKNNIDIDSLQSALESYYSVAQHVSLSNKNEGARNYGRYCACYCKIDDIYGDNRFKWYRAEVLNWNEEENKDVVVYLVDYGNKVTVGLSQLQPLAPQFGQHYMMAQRCHLSGVKCPEGGWPSPVCKYLKDLLALNEDYSVSVVPAINTVKNSLEIIIF